MDPVIGAAIAALPMSRLMSARGRRPGLVGGYLVALAGAVLMIVGTAGSSFALVVVGALMQGVATTANLQSRRAGARPPRGGGSGLFPRRALRGGGGRAARGAPARPAAHGTADRGHARRR